MHKPTTKAGPGVEERTTTSAALQASGLQAIGLQAPSRTTTTICPAWRTTREALEPIR